MILFLILHIYFVSFLDKPEKTAPQLSERAWAQREKWAIPTDQMDYPVSAGYQNELRKMDVKILQKSRWFNGVTCEMDEKTAAKVAELKFVTGVEMTRDNSTPVYGAPKKSLPVSDAANRTSGDDKTEVQLTQLNLQPLHEAGFEGQGILMAICDVGFQNAQNLSCFRQKELQLGHFDLTDSPDDMFATDSPHGTMCLSAVSGITEGFRGAATKAQYYLMRSEEIPSESPKEMDNLVVALEKADSLGVNVFSVSLGYAMFDNANWTLDKTELDGQSTRVSLAATIAARKGMLVCAAAGNEGNKDWKNICVPADADSILTVGAVSADGTVSAFSSFGPAADGRIKPDVCAMGVQTALINASGTVTNSNGTSFATPLIAGMAASLWSALPDENAMQIRERIIRSADRYNFPDEERYGYGIPDAWKAYTMKREDDALPLSRDALQEEQPRKIIRGEQILIIRHGHIYNLAGQRIE